MSKINIFKVSQVEAASFLSKNPDGKFLVVTLGYGSGESNFIRGTVEKSGVVSFESATPVTVKHARSAFRRSINQSK